MAKDAKQTLTPKLRFPEFRDAPTWHLSKIDDMLEEVARPIEMHDDETYSLVTVKRRYGGVVAREQLTGRAIKVKSQFIVRTDDFLISKRQIVHDACGVVPTELDGAMVSNEYSVLRARNNTDVRFFEYFAQQPAVSASFLTSSVGIVIEKMLFRLKTWLRLEFPFPTLAEQQKIADCLTSLDEVIAAQGQKVEALKVHKRGLMQQLFPREGETLPRLRFPEFLDDDRSEFKPIGEVAKVTTGDKDTQNKVDDGEYPFFVRSQNVERINSFSYDGEAVLTSGDGVGVGENYHYINGKFEFHQRVYCIYNFVDTLNGQFFFHYFSLHFKKRVKQMSAKNSVDSVRMSMITEMPIWFPAIEEQHRIADCLSSLDAQITAESEKLDALKTHKKGLMQQLFPSPEGD